MSYLLPHWLPFVFQAGDKISPGAEFQILDPYQQDAVRKLCRQFYEKYYGDQQKRTLILGINPGRLGAGITGISFTDPIRLQEKCHIENSMEKKAELSSQFVYDWIESRASVEEFYKNYLILSVCPIGFIRDGKNINYYDDRSLMKASEELIAEQQEIIMKMNIDRTRVFILGKGKNFRHFTLFNQHYKWFDRVIALPHPRWVMQYRFKNRYEIMQDMHDLLEKI